ncbi:hypothetical protein FA95DRAFT_549727 [Auriscalpium vulgare]|uniref:Uncharacterized protein n=1 Tax=Auriscalpium vulgare TaxID=40419 RepID=A0ACB8S490_9AGAM|nr:hypothetical protein FA95DRAFT_549727 [Auriscalpium vulgare]
MVVISTQSQRGRSCGTADLSSPSAQQPHASCMRTAPTARTPSALFASASASASAAGGGASHGSRRRSTTRRSRPYVPSQRTSPFGYSRRYVTANASSSCARGTPCRCSARNSVCGSSGVASGANSGSSSAPSPSPSPPSSPARVPSPSPSPPVCSEARASNVCAAHSPSARPSAGAVVHACTRTPSRASCARASADAACARKRRRTPPSRALGGTSTVIAVSSAGENVSCDMMLVSWPIGGGERRAVGRRCRAVGTRWWWWWYKKWTGSEGKSRVYKAWRRTGGHGLGDDDAAHNSGRDSQAPTTESGPPTIDTTVYSVVIAIAFSSKKRVLRLPAPDRVPVALTADTPPSAARHAPGPPSVALPAPARPSRRAPPPTAPAGPHAPLPPARPRA